MLAQNVRASRAYGSVYTKSSETAFSSVLKKSLRLKRSEYLNVMVGRRPAHVPLYPGGEPVTLVFLSLQTYGKAAMAPIPILSSSVALRSADAVAASTVIRFALKSLTSVVFVVSTVMTVGVTICNAKTARKKRRTVVIRKQTLKSSLRADQSDISEAPKPRHAAKLSCSAATDCPGGNEYVACRTAERYTPTYFSARQHQKPEPPR